MGRLAHRLFPGYGSGMNIPEVDPFDEREPVGILLHPDTWASLRHMASAVGRSVTEATRYPVIGLTSVVRPGQTALVYDVDALRLEFEAAGCELTEPGDSA